MSTTSAKPAPSLKEIMDEMALLYEHGTTVYKEAFKRWIEGLAKASAPPAAERAALKERIETIERMATKIQLDMHGMRNPKTEKQVRVYNSIIESLTAIRETCDKIDAQEKTK